MREVKFSDYQLKQSKIQLLGQMAQVVENNGVHMQHQARSLLDYGTIYGFKEFMKEIDNVSASEILEISNEIFDPEKISVLIYEQGK